MVNVERLINGSAASLEIDERVPLTEFIFDNRHIAPQGSVSVHLKLTRDGRDIIADGSMSADVAMACDHCGGDARIGITAEFSERFSPDDPEAYVLSGGTIELERMLCDQIVFGLPGKVVCGCCPGFTDMIEQPDETDNPFYILKQRFDSNTEV